MFHLRLNFTAAACAFLFLLPAAITGSAQSNPAAQLSFGRILIDEPIEETISFNNPTGEILEVEDVQLTPPLKAYDITRRIEPGGEARFRLVMGMDRKPGDFKGMIRVLFSNEGFPSVTFAVEGTIAPPVEFEPMPAFFIATHSGNENSGSIKITVNRVQPLAIIAAASNSDRFSVDLVPLESGKHYRLDLILDGNAAPGSKSEEILLKTNPSLEEPLIVQANTLIREPVYHFPDSIDMGILPLEAAKNKDTVSTFSQTLMVYRPDTSDFEVEAQIDLDFIKLVSERGPDGDRYQFTLTLIPEKVVPGKIEGIIRIDTNDKKYDYLEIQVGGHILE